VITLAKRAAELEAEKNQQVTSGIIGKGAKIGRKVYKMKKTEF
jgi:hypothetical protein